MFSACSSDECNIQCNGGAIYIQSSIAQLDNTIFSFDSAYSIITSNFSSKKVLEESGGAISREELICNNCSVINNSVFTIKRKDCIYGGAISSGNIKCTDCILLPIQYLVKIINHGVMIYSNHQVERLRFLILTIAQLKK